MTTINFISGKQIHCDKLEIDDIKELVRDEEGIPIEEQRLQPCWGREGGRGKGISNMCISMRTVGGKLGRNFCNNHADHLEQAKSHYSNPMNIIKCCKGGNPSFKFQLNATRPGLSCEKTYKCNDLGLPSGDWLDNFLKRNDQCGHLKVEFCNNGINLEKYGKDHCKFCMAHDSGCSESKIMELCHKNNNKGDTFYEECKCINTTPKSDLEKKLVEYNGENLACWSNECRNTKNQTQPRDDRFIPSLWWNNISACRTPSLCIMNFDGVDVEQYGGIINFHQDCGNGEITSGDPNINTPSRATDTRETDTRETINDIDKTEIDFTVPNFVSIIILFVFAFVFIVILKKKHSKRK